VAAQRGVPAARRLPPQLVTALRTLAVAVRSIELAAATDPTGAEDAAQCHAGQGEDQALDALGLPPV
jgi:hypothetical protein